MFRKFGHFTTSVAGRISSLGVGAATAALSNRGLAIITLLGCAWLCISPWFRPAMSRDFRGVHIPWSTLAGQPFFPPYSADVPRPWLWSSVGAAVLVAIAVAIFLVLARHKNIAIAFGIVLAASIPAVAAALWNHPGLMEFFESEVRQRTVLREVFRQQSEDLLVGTSPDRLVVHGKKNTPTAYHREMHPLVLPLRYSLYGPWLVLVAALGVLLATEGELRRRLLHGTQWAALGLLLAVAATWPRWVAEYHLARATSLENANRLAEAEQAVQRAGDAMPTLTYGRRYQLISGRLAYRQGIRDERTAFFIGHQHAVVSDYAEARAILTPVISQQGDDTAARELLAEVIGRMAAEHIVEGDYTSAELTWAEASQVAPWMQGHWLAQTTTSLAANPKLADELQEELLAQLDQVGDRLMHSDVASVIGDAYFNLGDFSKARIMYDRSIDNFHLPKYANLHAQQGRLGM